jgi:hypothetical protein
MFVGDLENDALTTAEKRDPNGFAERGVIDHPSAKKIQNLTKAVNEGNQFLKEEDLEKRGRMWQERKNMKEKNRGKCKYCRKKNSNEAGILVMFIFRNGIFEYKF